MFTSTRTTHDGAVVVVVMRRKVDVPEPQDPAERCEELRLGLGADPDVGEGEADGRKLGRVVDAVDRLRDGPAGAVERGWGGLSQLGWWGGCE